MNNGIGTTNDDSPFVPGDRINWSTGVTGTVITNDGNTGIVQYRGWGGDTEDTWVWHSEGIQCVRVEAGKQKITTKIKLGLP